MILLFGGTSEGRRLADLLASSGREFVYSTKDGTGFTAPPSCRYRHGPFTVASLDRFCVRENIRLIVDGSHPFAEDLRRAIEEAALGLSIPVLRFERSMEPRSDHELSVYVDGFDQALDYLRIKRIRSLLALTGVRSIAKLRSHWTEHETWFRILPRPESLEKARLEGLQDRFIVPGLPSQDAEAEMDLIRTLGVEAVLTKESGAAGGLPAKISAAVSCRIPILILRKPPVPESFAVVRTEAEFMDRVTRVSP